jgi:hypothetical protein
MEPRSGIVQQNRSGFFPRRDCNVQQNTHRNVVGGR